MKNVRLLCSLIILLSIIVYMQVEKGWYVAKSRGDFKQSSAIWFALCINTEGLGNHNFQFKWKRCLTMKFVIMVKNTSLKYHIFSDEIGERIVYATASLHRDRETNPWICKFNHVMNAYALTFSTVSICKFIERTRLVDIRKSTVK